MSKLPPEEAKPPLPPMSPAKSSGLANSLAASASSEPATRCEGRGDFVRRNHSDNSCGETDDETCSNSSSSRVPSSDALATVEGGVGSSARDGNIKGSSIRRTGSNLDLRGAFINENGDDDDDDAAPTPNPGGDGGQPLYDTKPAPSIGLPQQTVKDVSHFAIDLGGSLIKMVYFSPDPGNAVSSALGGRLHFKKWETKQYQECIKYIEKKQLHKSEEGKAVIVKATGGGAYKFQEEFRSQLGLQLEKTDEMKCLVSGCDFFLKALQDEVFTFMRGEKQYQSFGDESIYPYLLVNIGSGVSMIKVTGEGQHERISGTNVGGGTFWGLCKLLTGVKSFDDMLRLSAKGDNRAVDMLVGDIYGGNDYSKIGLASTTIASSFGKVVMDDATTLADYRPEDIALSLLRMISYNIAQVAVLNAMQYKLKRLIFGGFFTRGHPYTMETISYAIHYWSKGEYKAMFMRHEGFLGALGAFLQNESEVSKTLTRTVSNMHPQTMSGAWVEKFIRSARNGNISTSSNGASSTGSNGNLSTLPVASLQSPQRLQSGGVPAGREKQPSTYDGTGASPSMITDSNALQLGVLHLVPSLQVFPLLALPTKYTADTIDMEDAETRGYWIDVFKRHQSNVVEKAVASCQGDPANTETEQQIRTRAQGFQKAFASHLQRLVDDPAAFGRCSLNGIFEFREECLRDWGFQDAYCLEKARENCAALSALPDLLSELESLDIDERLLAVVEGILAGNIFDWGSSACVDLYQNDTILDMYRKARADLQRPWIVDDFEQLRRKLMAMYGGGGYRKVLILLDNSGADAVLGVIPFARELLRLGAEVVLSCNSMPALNDITVPELRSVLEEAGAIDTLLKNSLQSRMLRVVGNGSGSPCINLRYVSEELVQAAAGTDLLVLEGMGRAIHTNLHALFSCDCLKVAMIKNQKVAETLFQGNIYDCMCKFEPAYCAQ